jgi:hypothetical protein
MLHVRILHVRMLHVRMLHVRMLHVRMRLISDVCPWAEARTRHPA